MISDERSIDDGSILDDIHNNGAYTGDVQDLNPAPQALTDISYAGVTLSQYSFVYNKTVQTPSISVTLDGVTLIQDVDYTLTRTSSDGDGTSGGMKVGMVSIRVTGINSYDGYIIVTYTITPKPITIESISPLSKTYDGNTIVVLSSAFMKLDGVESGDTVSIADSSITCFLSDSNVGEKSLSFSTSLKGTSAGNYTLKPPTIKYSVTPKSVGIVNVVAIDRVYDGTTTVEITGGSLNDVLSGDVSKVNLVLPSTGTMSNANIGDNKSVTVTGAYLTGSASGNYILSQPTGVMVNISPKIISITNVSATDRAYDQTKDVTITGTLLGVVPGDLSAVGYDGIGTMADANAGDNKPVTANITLTGDVASNYTLEQQPIGITVNISKKNLTMSGMSYTVPPRFYNGTNTVPLMVPVFWSLTGVESGDVVSYAPPNIGTVSNVNAGWREVTIDTTLAGAASGNYSLTQPTIYVTILPKPIYIIGIEAIDREYDGTTTVILSGGSLDGVLVADKANVGFTPGIGTMADAKVGDNKSVAVTGSYLTNDALGNYVLAEPIGVTVNISPKTITWATNGTVFDKEFDGNTNATISVHPTLNPSEIENDDEVIVNASAAMASFMVMFPDTSILVTASGYALSGEDSSNYILEGQPAFNKAKITKAKAIVTPAAGQKQFGANDPSFDFTLPDGFPAGSTTGSLGRVPGEAVGEYDYTLDTLKLSSPAHYAIYELVLDTSVKFEITKATGQAVDIPTENTKSGNSITINAVDAPIGQEVEYAINTANSTDGLTWQSGTSFLDLDPETDYYIFARSKGNDNYLAGMFNTDDVTLFPLQVTTLTPQPPSITTPSLIDGTFNVSYNQTLTANGDTPITWTIIDGDLPTGLTLNANGTISGTPTAAGVFNFTVKATNATGNGTKEISITISKVIVSVVDPVYDGDALILGDDLPTISGATSGGTYTLDAGQTLVVGTNGYTWTFTPVDTANYEYIGTTGTISLTVGESTDSGDNDGDDNTLLYVALAVVAVVAVLLVAFVVIKKRP